MCCYTPPSYFITRVRAKHDAFRACYNAALQRRPDLRGRIAARFVLEEDGTVTRACDAGSDLDDPEMLACVLRVFTTLTFDPYVIGDPCPAVTVNYPLAFSPEP
ncbi:Hypothetical protein CAP_8927 [Chondromyces apiculatus DSM 436]|uniref:TonB C-terminal domain-containing protein n=2 Tax=Chondromyces apiculatus TaxID=51 RepID=A0A017SV13_9BACT|nr:Hypothetical protein CAP_8927 [Chondromyces apiculatus DSM 436]